MILRFEDDTGSGLLGAGVGVMVGAGAGAGASTGAGVLFDETGRMGRGAGAIEEGLSSDGFVI